MALQEEYAGNFDEKYGVNGFMFHIHSSIDLRSGEGESGATAVCGDIKLVY